MIYQFWPMTKRIHTRILSKREIARRGRKALSVRKERMDVTSSFSKSATSETYGNRSHRALIKCAQCYQQFSGVKKRNLNGD